MAADSAISERIYITLRRRLLAGEFRLRQRLDVGRLAGEMQASATPVREALTRLATERLISAKPTRGFFAVLWSERELFALYEWRSALTRFALDSVSDANLMKRSSSVEEDYADAVRQTLVAIEASANLELRLAAANADDRLHLARRVEPETLQGAMDEVAALAAARTRKRLLPLLRRYHAKRMQNVGAIRDRAVLHALPSNGE